MENGPEAYWAGDHMPVVRLGTVPTRVHRPVVFAPVCPRQPEPGRAHWSTMFVPSKTMWASVVAFRTKWGGTVLGTGRQSMSALAPQVPFTQEFPAAQAVPAFAPWQFPEAPQYWLLSVGSTHELPQAMVPVGQVQTAAVQV